MGKFPAWLYVASGAVGICLFGCLSIYTGTPTAVSPYALAVAVPAFFVAEVLDRISQYPHQPLFLLLSATPVSVFYLAWSSHLFRGTPTLPRRSIVLLILVIILSAWDAAGSWSFGLSVQGFAYTVFVIVICAIVLATLIALGVWARRSPSFLKNFAFHTFLFAWLAWGAFPWLGELP